MIKRILNELINKKLFAGKVILITGARQTGKSTLLRSIEKDCSTSALFLDCDDTRTRSLLHDQTTPNLQRLVADKRLVLIDEAQRVENIGLTLKQIFDNSPGCQLVVSGSSAFELSNKINEPLTGRKWEYQLFPISFSEMVQHTSWLDEIRLIETRLIYGYYPDVINHPGNEVEILQNLVNSYLYKDVFTFQDIRKPQLIEKLLQLLAFQIASEVSYNELAQTLQVNVATVERYIDLLEKSFVIFRLPSFSRNCRNELKKSRKIFFYDNGVRNMLISNFNNIELRQDTGKLWENFLVSERLKRNQYSLAYCNRYFWRTTQQQEIDYIEEKDGKLIAYEFKWSANRKPQFPKTFSVAYPNTEFISINKENFSDFLLA